MTTHKEFKREEMKNWRFRLLWYWYWPKYFIIRWKLRRIKMTAQDLIDQVVTGDYSERAHVRAIIEDKDSWFHVHRDEELPDNYPTVVYIRV